MLMQTVDGVRRRPPLIAGAYLLAALALNYVVPTATIVTAPYNALGAVIVAAGLALVIWAVRLFRRAGTTHLPWGTPTALVADGPYRFTRNPMYLGMLLVLLGIAFFLGTLPMFLAPLAFYLTIDATAIPREEAMLTRSLGEAYVAYTRRVRRWL